jgi:hypothetical protein
VEAEYHPKLSGEPFLTLVYADVYVDAAHLPANAVKNVESVSEKVLVSTHVRMVDALNGLGFGGFDDFEEKSAFFFGDFQSHGG